MPPPTYKKIENCYSRKVKEIQIKITTSMTYLILWFPRARRVLLWSIRSYTSSLNFTLLYISTKFPCSFLNSLKITPSVSVLFCCHLLRFHSRYLQESHVGSGNVYQYRTSLYTGISFIWEVLCIWSNCLIGGGTGYQDGLSCCHYLQSQPNQNVKGKNFALDVLAR